MNRIFMTITFLYVLPAWAALSGVNIPQDLTPRGSAHENPLGTWTIRASGTDIWNNCDECYYLYDTQGQRDDFSIRCHVKSFQDSGNDWAKLGLMARTETSQNNPLFKCYETMILCCITPGNGKCIHWRDGNVSQATWANFRLNSHSKDVWLHLDRVDDEFFGYASYYPGIWFSLLPADYELKFQNLLGRRMHVGVALTSHDRSNYATAVVDSLDFDSKRISTKGPTKLTCSEKGTSVKLSWNNMAIYDRLKLFRVNLNGEPQQIIPGPEAGDSTFIDRPGTGLWRYWISAEHQGHECVANGDAIAVLDPDLQYAKLILSDDPIAYWRMNESEGDMALNWGNIGPAINSLYKGICDYNQPGLMPSGEDHSVRFKGGEIMICDHQEINLSGPYLERSIELWFKADRISSFPGVLFEEGGCTRGISLYVMEVNGEKRLYGNAWNYDELPWDRVFVFHPVEEDMLYHAVLVFKSDYDGDYGTPDGKLQLYLNGSGKEVTGTNLLYSHGDNTCIGGIDTNCVIHTGVCLEDGANFFGSIDEVAIYDYALDRKTSILYHWYSGIGLLGEGKFKRGDVNDDGRLDIADAINLLDYLFNEKPDPICPDSADANDDGRLDISDAIKIIDALFVPGTVMPAPDPFKECGKDPTDDDLPLCFYRDLSCSD